MSIDKATWRLIDSPAASGWENMAIDTILAKNTTIPTLRFYTWNPWTISLGRHQSSQDIDLDQCKEDGVDVVRRPTGGQAILHAEELTYSVTVPNSHPWFAESIHDVYRSISKALLSGIENIGVNAIAQENPEADQIYTNNFACFATAVSYEIAIDAAKLIGSAQRRYKNGVLQHGSILVGRAHESLPKYIKNFSHSDKAAFDQHATCLQDALGFQPHLEEIKNAVIDGFVSTFGIQFDKSELNQQEQQLSISLTHTLKNGEDLQ